MSYQGKDAAGMKRWTCDNCGKASAWTDSWVWFGSINDMDTEGHSVPVFCSQVCGEANGRFATPAKEKKKRGERPDPLAKLSKVDLIAMLNRARGGA